MTTRPERDGDDGNVDVEAAFADIVAHWDEPDAAPVGRWPAAEDVTDDAPAGDDAPERPADGDTSDDGWTVGPEPLAVGAGPAPARERDGERPSGPRDAPRADEEEGFTPPDPPPLPRGDLVSRLAWSGVLGAPVFFLLCALVWRDVPRSLVLAAIAAFVAGFVTLVLRMPADRDDGWDDGAVV